MLLILACAEDRALLSVPVTFEPSAASFGSNGAEIELVAATVTVADLRLESPAVATLPFFPAAYAHPGHDYAGGTAGELLGTWTLDLLGAAQELGNAACYEGNYATARLDVLPEPTVVLEGTATLTGAAHPFRFELAPDQELTGVPFVAELDAEAPPAGISLGIDLPHALAYVDWKTPDGDGDGVLTEADGALANTALFGVVSTPTWLVTLEP